MRFKFSKILPSAGVLAMLMTAPAYAQDADTSSAEAEDEIVVTGTFIRGIAPAGANVIGVDETDVEASGATGANQLLATVPQVSNMFNEVNSTGQFSTQAAGQGALAVNAAIQINRPTLRGLTANTASGSSTLVLVDGHRVVGAGVSQSVPDPDIVPPGAIQRVEVLPDGGSSLYGADAVGGVINFITRREYDGFGVDARYGFADNYETYDTNITGGTSWGSGSIYASFNFAKKTPVFGADRDYIQALDWDAPGGPVPNALNCAVGNVIVNNVTYAIDPNSTTLGPAGSANRCDNTDYQTISPDEDRIGVSIGFRQDLTDSITFDTRMFLASRDTLSYSGSLGGTDLGGGGFTTVSPGNPNYRPIPGVPGPQTVRFNFAPVVGNTSATARTVLEEYGITPTLTVDLWADWQANLMANYGQSEVWYRSATVNNTLVNTLTATGAFNPYDIASSDPDAIAAVLDYSRYGAGRNEMTNYRAVFDGPLFSLPGGQVSAAFGFEYLKEGFDQRQAEGTRATLATLDFDHYDRDVNAAFAELNIPIVGDGNRLPGIYSLTLSVSARRDEYSDFGDTTNPKYAITYEPVDWVMFRGNWSTSFNAPTVVDQLGGTAGAQVSPAPGLYPDNFDTGQVHEPGQFVLFAGALGGSVQDLQPQEATIWSAGVDVTPPWIEGLRTSATYYNIEYNGELGRAPFFNPEDMVANYSNLITYNAPGTGDDAAIVAAIQEYQNFAINPDELDFFIDNPDQVFALVDARIRNLGASRHSGVDFSADYTHETPWGSIDAGIGGNYRLIVSRSRSGGPPFTKVDLDNEQRFSYRAYVGTTVGDLYARASYSHGEGYHVSQPTQTEVDDFNLVDLFFRYDLGGLSLAEDFAVTMNVNNVLDEAPPEYRIDGGSGIANGSTLGRTILIGFNSRF